MAVDGMLTRCCLGREVRHGDWRWIMLSLRHHIVIGANAEFGLLPDRGRGRRALLLLSVGGGRLFFLSFRDLVDPVQGGEVPGEGMQDAQLDAEGFVVAAIPAGEEGGITDGQEGDQIADQIAAGGGVEFGGIGGQRGGLREEFLAGLRFDEAAIAPFIEILFGDGLAGKVAGQDGLDVGRGIEPMEEGGAVLVGGETAVEFSAEAARQAGDFSFTLHNGLFSYDALWRPDNNRLCHIVNNNSLWTFGFLATKGSELTGRKQNPRLPWPAQFAAQ